MPGSQLPGFIGCAPPGLVSRVTVRQQLTAAARTARHPMMAPDSEPSFAVRPAHVRCHCPHLNEHLVRLRFRSGSVRYPHGRCAIAPPTLSRTFARPGAGGKAVYPMVEVKPPSTTRVVPVIYLASSEARNSAACAVSQASPCLPVGHSLARRRSIASASPP